MPDHHESILLDEPTTADLRAKVTEAWGEFARALAARLPTLPAGAHLELTLDPTASGIGDAVYSVSVDVDATGGVVAPRSATPCCREGYRLDRRGGGRHGRARLVAARRGGGLRRAASACTGRRTRRAGWPRSCPGPCATSTAPRIRRSWSTCARRRGEPLRAAPLGTARSEFGPDRDVEADLDEALGRRGRSRRRRRAAGRSRCGTVVAAMSRPTPTAAGRQGRRHRHPGRLGDGLRPGPRQPAAGRRLLPGAHRGRADREAVRASSPS